MSMLMSMPKSMSVQSFNAISNSETHTLILGTMPGVASLNAHQYYAHKRNAFWPIILAHICDREPEYGLHELLSYEEKLNKLTKAGFGLWDVLAECEREGSLDSAIKNASVQANDFSSFLQHNTNIHTIVFNGKAAQRLFKKHVQATLMGYEQLSFHGMPSTSPAMASLTLKEKYLVWRDALSGQRF